MLAVHEVLIRYSLIPGHLSEDAILPYSAKDIGVFVLLSIIVYKYHKVPTLRITYSTNLTFQAKLG